MPRDLYEVLGLKKNATEEEIKRAYRKLARENHPDRNPGDKQAEKRFKEVQDAYQILSDKKKRDQYDRFGFVGPEMGGPGTGGAPGGFHFQWGGTTESGFQFDPSDLADFLRGFEGFTGGTDGFTAPGGFRGRRTAPTREYVADISIPLARAALGGPVDIQVDGKTITVKIRPGTEDGQTLRLRGQGPDGGDLLLKVHIQPHEYFRRDGNDLTVEVPISLPEAVLGTKIDVPTLDGHALSVTVPPGTSSGARLRLKGKGIAGGDLYVEIKIVVPTVTDKQSRELIEQFAKLNPQQPRKNLPWT